MSREVEQINRDGPGGGEGSERAEVKSAHGNLFRMSLRTG